MKYLRCYGSGPGRTGNNGYVCLEQEKYVIDPKGSSYKPMISYVQSFRWASIRQAQLPLYCGNIYWDINYVTFIVCFLSTNATMPGDLKECYNICAYKTCVSVIHVVFRKNSHGTF